MKRKYHRFSTLKTLVFAAIFTATSARAAVTITVSEVGGDVVFTRSAGTLDLTGLTFIVSGSGGGGEIPAFPSISWSNGTLIPSDTYAAAFGPAPAPFGTGGVFNVDSFTGPYLFLNSSNRLGIAQGFVSGSTLAAGTMTKSGATFASLGITPGSVSTWNWGADSITLTVAGSVPEPSRALLVGMGGFCLLWRRRRA